MLVFGEQGETAIIRHDRQSTCKAFRIIVHSIGHVTSQADELRISPAARETIACALHEDLRSVMQGA